MKFITNINKEDYQKYYQKSPCSSFLQSYEWGQFCQKGKNMVPYYVGILDDNDKLIATSLLLKKPLPFGKCYFYAPRGFNFDFDNKDLLKYFTNEIKAFIREQGAIYLTIDPEIMYQELNNDAEIIPNGKNNYQIHQSLLNLGYQHRGFNKNYENNQPRYTFIINLDDEFSNVENRMNKSFLKNVEKSKKLGVEFVVGNESDLDTFNIIYNKTKERDNFLGFDENYYRNFYLTMHPNKMAEVFLCKIYPKIIIKTLKNELDEISKELKIITNQNKRKIIENKQEKIKKDLDFFLAYQNEDSIVVSAHIMGFYNNSAVALYAGNLKEFQNTYANNYLYYEKIKYAHKIGCKRLDLFGVTGDPKTTIKNLAGIYEFKKQLGGYLIEYIGEYELIINKLWYKLLDIYRRIKY